MHVLSATHCFDGKEYINGQYKFINEWGVRKGVGIGVHEENKGYPNNENPHGVLIERDTGWTLLQNKTIIEFPLWCAVGCKFGAKDLALDIVLDVAVIQLKEQIMFFPGYVGKAKLDSPSSNCQTCLDDCDSGIAFKAMGWGFVTNGKYCYQRVITMEYFLNQNYVMFKSLIIYVFIYENRYEIRRAKDC